MIVGKLMMKRHARTPRVLVVVGFLAMVGGAIDPLEGSLVVLAGSGLAALGAWLRKSRYVPILTAAFGLVAIGTALLWGLSAMGGIGGQTGRSMWWGLVLAPYPVGWVMGLVGAVRCMREEP